MIAADEWHKYQEDYVKYGIALEPEIERPKREPAKEPAIKVSAKEKSHILLTILLIGLCGVAIIFMQAYASDINYSIYSLNQEVDALEGDIDNLTVQLNSGGGLDYVEWYAANNLGMMYLTGDQYVYVNNLEGSAEVESYIAELTASQKGVVGKAMEKNASSAARRLLAGAAVA